MKAKVFYDKPFDEETKVKLAIFRQYIREWIPVFLVRSSNNLYYRDIYICDFFTGRGEDIKGTSGSSKIILEEIIKFYKTDNSFANVNLRILLNDSDPTNVEQYLKFSIVDLQKEIESLKRNITIKITCQKFQDIWNKVKPFFFLKNSASLLIMDQFGISDLSQDIFKEIAQLKTTDILFFIASSFFNRFYQQDWVKEKKLPIDPVVIQNNDNYVIHRYICDVYKSIVPHGINFYLAPFSIRRKSNINGIIFGSSNLLGLEKFLNVAWSIDKHSGEANYNIDHNITYKNPNQKLLFEEVETPSKKSVFLDDLWDYIINNSPTNRDLYRFGLEHGFIPKIINEILSLWKRESKIEIVPLFDGVRKSFYISYNVTPKIRVKAIK